MNQISLRVRLNEGGERPFSFFHHTLCVVGVHIPVSLLNIEVTFLILDAHPAMDLQTLSNIFATTFSPDPNVRKAGELDIRKVPISLIWSFMNCLIGNCSYQVANEEGIITALLQIIAADSVDPYVFRRVFEVYLTLMYISAMMQRNPPSLHGLAKKSRYHALQSRYIDGPRTHRAVR